MLHEKWACRVLSVYKDMNRIFSALVLGTLLSRAVLIIAAPSAGDSLGTPKIANLPRSFRFMIERS